MESKKLLRIRNFRSLEDIELEIRPLTFLFGKNGSGKSSVLKAIRFLGNNVLPIDYNSSTKYDFEEFNLGSFKEIVTNNDALKQIIFEYKEITESKTARIEKVFKGVLGYESNRKNLQSMEFAFFIGKIVEQYLYTFHLSENGMKVASFSAPNSDLLNEKASQDKYIELLDSWIAKEFNFENELTGLPDDPDEIINRISGEKNVNKLREFFESYFKDFLEKLKPFFNRIYISSNRKLIAHKYLLTDEENFDDKEYYGLLNKLSDDYKLLEAVNKIVENLNLAREIRVAKQGEVGKLQLVSNGGGVCNFAEANSGIQRSLPIIAFNELYSSASFLLEQPEIELHPKLQCQLIEYISQGKNNFIIETHSEHIIRKIQVLIAQGRLKKEKVAVYYFNKDKETGITRIEEMELEDNGFFKEPWPDGFFDEASDLAYALLEAQIGRKN